MKTLTKDEFIQKFRAKYDKDYSFDLFEYVNNKTKSKVICPKHGVFEIRPNDLLSGMGCPACGGTKKYTNEEYKDLVNQTHHGYYDLSLVNYTRGTDKVKVICPTHGEFQIQAKRLLRGCICPQCAKEKVYHEITPILNTDKKWCKDTTETFCQKVIDKYGEIFDLSRVNYQKSSIKVDVICKQHGLFQITPNKLLMGRGCPICAGNKPLTTESFIDKSKQLYPNLFDYTKTIYKNYSKPVILTCKKHGDFLKTPRNHLKGQSCPICSQSRLEERIRVLLEQNNLNYIREYSFEDLGRYRYDFFVPNKKLLIECQGIQHFEDIPFFNKKSTWQERYERDKLKYEYAISHGYKIIYLFDKKRTVKNMTIYKKNYFYDIKEIELYIKMLK